MRFSRPLALAAAVALATSARAAPPPNVTVNVSPIVVRPYSYYPPYNRPYYPTYDGVPITAPPPNIFTGGAAYAPLPLWATYSGPLPGIPTSALQLPLGPQTVSTPAAYAANAAAAAAAPPFIPAQPAPAGNGAIQAQPLFGAQAMQAAPAGNPGFAAGQARVAPGGASVVDQAVQLLNSPRDRDRIDAAMMLGRNRVEKAVDPLVRVLQNDPSPRVREAVVRSLGLIGTPACLKALETAAQSDDSTDVRRSARFAVQVLLANTR
jgi:hypothetical protein